MNASRERPDESWSALTIVVLVVAMAAFAVVAWAVPGMGACGGDGGAPSARPGSRLAHACSWRDDWTPVLIWGPVALVVVGSLIGKLRRHWWPTLVATAASFVLVVVPLVVITAADGPGQRT